eukprot:6300011-Prymnesium_polylepis.2
MQLSLHAEETLASPFFSGPRDMCRKSANGRSSWATVASSCSSAHCEACSASVMRPNRRLAMAQYVSKRTGCTSDERSSAA